MKIRENVKTIFVFLCLSVLFLALTACADKHTSNEPTLPISNPVTEITCIEPSNMPMLLAAKDGNVLACWSDYEAMTTHLRIVDIANDSVAASLDLNGCLDLFPENFSDGGFVLRDSANSRWLFLDAQLKEIADFPSEIMDGFFTHDRSRFYYLEDRFLCCAETANGTALPVDLPYNLRFSHITGFHPTHDTIAIHVYTSPFTTDCGTAILDLDSGSFSMIQSSLYQTTFGEKYIKLLRFDNEAMQYEVTYCSSEGAKQIPATQFAQNIELVSVDGADYLVGIGNSTELLRLSNGVESCSLAQNGVAGELRDVCWINERSLLIGSVWQSSSATIYAICPELLSFSEMDAAQSVATPITVDDAIAENYWGKLAGDSLPKSMQGLRELANRIEQTYHVQILLSDQCEELAQYSNYELVLTGTMSESEEQERIGFFLSSLERSLSMYPEGFFDQFRRNAKDGGVCFLPVEQIISDNGLVGVCYEGANWYAIALDIRTDSMVNLICHEIWHATENKILGDNYTLFWDEEWAKFNPDGFQYNEDRNIPDTFRTHWTLFDNAGEIYFIDDYACTNSREDRARLMEYVMAKPEYHEQLKASPALMSKLKYMCDAIRNNFNTTGWRSMPWEALAG